LLVVLQVIIKGVSNEFQLAEQQGIALVLGICYMHVQFGRRSWKLKGEINKRWQCFGLLVSIMYIRHDSILGIMYISYCLIEYLVKQKLY
jgi:hypothetical protein